MPAKIMGCFNRIFLVKQLRTIKACLSIECKMRDYLICKTLIYITFTLNIKK